MPQSQVFTLNKKKYQLFFETTIHDRNDGNNNHVIDNIMTSFKPRGLHDYYCTFLNKRTFNTRYINYDPDEHKFKNHNVKNRNKNHNLVGFHLNVDLSKLSNMKRLKKM